MMTLRDDHLALHRTVPTGGLPRRELVGKLAEARKNEVRHYRA